MLNSFVRIPVLEVEPILYSMAEQRPKQQQSRSQAFARWLHYQYSPVKLPSPGAGSSFRRAISCSPCSSAHRDLHLSFFLFFSSHIDPLLSIAVQIQSHFYGSHTYCLSTAHFFYYRDCFCPIASPRNTSIHAQKQHFAPTAKGCKSTLVYFSGVFRIQISYVVRHSCLFIHLT